MIRVDSAPALVISDDASSPTRTSAAWTEEGYLEADAYLARDGLLTYSDGKGSWQEYRPKDELVDAAQSWYLAPVTDDHPKRMVDANTHSAVARGMVISPPVIETIDGVTYLKARLRFTDAGLIRKLEAGEQREISIGFTAEVDSAPGSFNGVRYDAVQRQLRGNHVASVPKGRAGASVRVFLDGATVPVYYHQDHSTSHDLGDRVKNQNPKKTKKVDEAGMPTMVSKIVAPDGTEIEVPTWVAAAIEELANLKQQEKPPAEEPEAAAVAEPESAEVASDELPAPVGEEEEEEEKMSADSIRTLVRRRARLERLADRAGIDPDKYDTDADLAKVYIASRIPAMKLDGLGVNELFAVVEAAAAVPVPEDRPRHTINKKDSMESDASLAAEIRFLKKQQGLT